MEAKFEMGRPHEPVIILTPDRGTEAILMAAFLRYDANAFSVSVERYDDGQIKEVTLIANDAR